MGVHSLDPASSPCLLPTYAGNRDKTDHRVKWPTSPDFKDWLEMSATHNVTELLAQWANGDEQALNRLTPIVYKELRKLAAAYLRKEQQGHTLQPTALVHEAYMRLVHQENPDFKNRSHFFGVAARLMRQILVDHARRRHATKRASISVPIDAVASFKKERSEDLLALDRGLSALEQFDPRKCKAVELRYFVGLSMQEIAQALELSEITVRRDLRMAEAWLQREIDGR
jgi:RNA polymerase sigma-70 factor (ECF subfamily)